MKADLVEDSEWGDTAAIWAADAPESGKVVQGKTLPFKTVVLAVKYENLATENSGKNNWPKVARIELRVIARLALGIPNAKNYRKVL